MAHGTSATITMVADRYADVLHEVGFAVLLYDHRNFGISDGEPRGEINPWVQARGYRDAIDYVSTLPEIDKSRVAIWGDSFSAGQVLVVGACDDRVKAIVSQTTACGPTMPPRDADGTLFAAVKSTYDSGSVSTSDAVTGPLPVVSFDQHGTPSLLTPISAYRWFIEYGGRHGTRWENWVTRVIPKTPAPYHPGICAPYVKAPTLMMIAPEDEMAGANPAVARAAYDSIPAKKELVEIAGGHFGLLHYPSELFDQAACAQRDFLVRMLL
jgi:pimeloyl-ACP methyl ester carboxylesterase